MPGIRKKREPQASGKRKGLTLETGGMRKAERKEMTETVVVWQSIWLRGPWTPAGVTVRGGEGSAKVKGGKEQKEPGGKKRDTVNMIKRLVGSLKI